MLLRCTVSESDPVMCACVCVRTFFGPFGIVQAQSGNSSVVKMFFNEAHRVCAGSNTPPSNPSPLPDNKNSDGCKERNETFWLLLQLRPGGVFQWVALTLLMVIKMPTHKL